MISDFGKAFDPVADKLTQIAMLFCLVSRFEGMLLPLVLLGAFGYHMIFEGKSQYILTYIILMIPTAAWAAVTLMESKFNLLSKIKEDKHE
jgi:hypothetical protein